MRLANASLIYQRKIIFDGVNLSLPAHQWTCILGPSGVGKSSLLRLIARLPITDGIASAECDIASADIAYMTQTDSLLPWLDILNNLFIGAKLRGYKISLEQKTHALAMLTELGIAELRHKKPHQLSGGERQRAALARTLFEHKSVILMDEPFSALDAITKWNLQALSAEYLRDKTVLLITHDPLEALRLGHHIYVMAGSPAVLENPITLGSPTPRALEKPEVQSAYTVLMRRLEEAHT